MHEYVCVCIVWVCVCVNNLVYVYVHEYVCVFFCMCVRVYVCACMHVCVHMSSWTLQARQILEEPVRFKSIKNISVLQFSLAEDYQYSHTSTFSSMLSV